MVSCIISYKQDCPFRKKNIDFLIDYLDSLKIKGQEIIVVEQDHYEKYFNDKITKKIFIKNKNMFNKGLGYNIGVENAKNDILFFCDADILILKIRFEDALDYLIDKNYDVVDPYEYVYYLNKKDTEIIIKNKFMNIDELRPTKRLKSGVISGGCFFIKKKCFNEVKGFDDRIYGYGHEDDVFDLKIIKLGYKITRFENGSSIHMFHPIQPKSKYFSRLNENKKIWLKYINMSVDELKNKIKKDGLDSKN